jgi:hypothetical protein
MFPYRREEERDSVLWNCMEELRVPMWLFSDTFTPESLLRSGIENLDRCSCRLLTPSRELPVKKTLLHQILHPKMCVITCMIPVYYVLYIK